MASGDKCGAKSDRGGEATGLPYSSLAACGSRSGEDDERYSGGAEVALREDLRDDVEALGAATLRVRGFGGGRAGEDDSAPDWKTLLSSHPLSSANCEYHEHTKLTVV